MPFRGADLFALNLRVDRWAENPALYHFGHVSVSETVFVFLKLPFVERLGFFSSRFVSFCVSLKVHPKTTG